jgi:nitric oxide reductase NorD protein
MDQSSAPTRPYTLNAADQRQLSAVLEHIPAQQRDALATALTRTCELLSPKLHAPLLQCVQAAAAIDPRPLPAVVPLIGPTLSSFSASSRWPILERIVQLAEAFPVGVSALFRTLGRAYDAAGEDGVLRWIRVGEAIGLQNMQAGVAFFALTTQTSQRTLRGVSPIVRLGEVQGILLKFLHMLSGTSSGLVETPMLFVPPPLAETEGEWIPLPACVDVFPTHEDNFRLYRVLIAHQAGRLLFGTYDCVPSTVWESFPPYVHTLLGEGMARPHDCAAYFLLFPRADLIEDLFLCFEAKRIAARLIAHYRGLADDLVWADRLTELYPAVPAALLSQISAEGFVDLERTGTASDSLVWASQLYAQSLQDEQPMASGSASVTEIDFDEVPEQAAAFMTGVNLSRGSSELDEFSEEEEIARRRGRTARDLHYVYDEWDYEIEDYRSHWCELREVSLAEDNGVFFSRTLATYAELTPDIKREFQRLRPKMFHLVKGLEDGEDIDLNAMVTARVDRRLGNTPSSKLYVARQQVQRDVGVLFLVDLSASTGAALADAEGVATQQDTPRVIDVIKESLVLLSVALEEIGDSYAIYGFSSRGRNDVEVYPVKTFRDSLSAEVKGRIGALSPQGSTRMGTAVRHATRKLKDLATRAKLLVLLSDGYPEDPGYGKPVVPPMYGLRDTLMAFREAERSGILSYCLTVDKGGHDYLQEMCAPSRYMVIDDIVSLPTELPKIYQRYIWSQWL